MIPELPSPGSTDPDDLAVLAGLKVVDDDDDDPVLLYPDGRLVDTWREDYPYDTPEEYLEFMREAPEFERWTAVKSNDKKRARLEAMRHILEQFDYPRKDTEIVGKPDRKIIGPPSLLSEQATISSFTRL